MKTCPRCGNVLEDDAAFCDKCGTRLEEQNNTQQQFYSGYNQQQYQPYEPPKKKNVGLMIGIIAAFLILLAAIGILAVKFYKMQNKEESSNSSQTSVVSANSSETPVESVNSKENKTYTKGSVSGGIYTNEWANIRVNTVRTGWSNGSAEDYASYEGNGTECGLILSEEEKGSQLAICFEKLTGVNKVIKEDQYLDIITDNLLEQYESMDFSCTVDEYYDTTLDGVKYRSARITFEGGILVQEFHVRNYDGYIIFIGVTATSATDALNIANMIEAVE